MPRARLIFTFAAVFLSGLTPTLVHAEQAHGIAMHGDPALPEDFKNFPYVNADAPKGGRLTAGVLGSFDSLNPLIVNGDPVQGMREYVFESLLARSLSEPFTLYGLLAEKIEVTPNRDEITFHLNPKAKFSDGKPVTADDVIFSFETLRDKGRPNHRSYYSKAKSVERLSDRTVRFVLDGTDRELPLILGLMPVLPRHHFKKETFDKTTLVPPIGSGPYKIKSVDPGRSITYERNANYWGKDLGANRGRFNFNEIKFEYFRESSSLFVAFKNGTIDVRTEHDPALWAQGYDFPAVREGRVVKDELKVAVPAGMTGLVFNTRRPIFQDQRVRQALIQLLDFEWMNKTLFNSLYKRTQSFFERSHLSSEARPADSYEREILEPFANDIKPEILDGSYRLPKSNGTGHDRKNARKAFGLLKAAGYAMKNGALINTKTGKPLTFEILARSKSQERILTSFANSLSKLGIKANIRVVDSAQYQSRLRDYDYDMMQFTWPSSLSPGNEQIFRWSSKVADAPGSYNYAGVKSPAVDAMIQRLLEAKTQDNFVSSVRALDRVLRSGDYVIPLFHAPTYWVAYWSRIAHPETLPLNAFAVETWWHKKEDEQKQQ